VSIFSNNSIMKNSFPCNIWNIYVSFQFLKKHQWCFIFKYKVFSSFFSSIFLISWNHRIVCFSWLSCIFIIKCFHLLHFQIKIRDILWRNMLRAFSNCFSKINFLLDICLDASRKASNISCRGSIISSNYASYSSKIWTCLL